MSRTLHTLLGLAKSSVRSSPALCQQVSTFVFIVKQDKHLLSTCHERDSGKSCHKDPLRYYSLRAHSSAKLWLRNKHIQLRELSCPAAGNVVGEKSDPKDSTEVVEVLSVVRDEEDWMNEMQLVKSPESGSALLPPKDVSDIDVLGPELRPTFNLAAYVNKSDTLQQLLRLGVDLSSWDKRKGVSSFILPLDFERDIKQYIVFLHDVGVPADDLGRWLTINPLILKENIDNLQARVTYLESMKFSSEQITRIISKNPYWLLYSNIEIDKRLGFFQQSFKLIDDEVRYLATKQPRLLTYSMSHIKRTTFSVLEEMGFEKNEMKMLLLAKPKIWMAAQGSLFRRFDFVHNHMGMTHQQILEFPQVLLTRDFKIKQRHKFLKLIGRDQYDASQPNYVSPLALVSGTDPEFCINIAKSSVQTFNDFLKTL